MTELLSCPFCGGEAHTTETARYGNRWGVRCGSYAHCGAFLGFYITEAEAIAAWNTRAERTCGNISGKNWWAFECSECSEMIEQGVPEYCPSCGAKVVGE